MQNYFVTTKYLADFNKTLTFGDFDQKPTAFKNQPTAFKSNQTYCV